ncbi:hypothetical protein C8Q76DRAFT_165345 [Earliella scabrosa]|nr:hypothetical protein C8Q76DRAFT_165345 [Earliella scabrosa]
MNISTTMSSQHSGPSQAYLNYDILLMVLTEYQISRRTAAAMMRTCQVLYHSGAAVVLRDPVALQTLAQLRSFLAFIQAEDGTRFPFLHTLAITLDVGDFAEDIAAALCQCVSKMTHLRSLTLTRAETLLEADPRLVDAFASLQRVETLALSNVGRLACTLLRSMRSPLVHATLLDPPPDKEDEDDPFWNVRAITGKIEDPVDLLARCAPTLTTLESNWASLCRGSRAARPKHVYPALTHLRVVDPPHLSMVQYTAPFPHLTHLALDRPSGYRPPVDWNMPVLWRREDNILAQQQHQQAPRVHLHELSGGLWDLYELAVRCPVDTLLLGCVAAVAEESSMLLQVLEDCTPAVLRLELTEQAYNTAVGFPCVALGVRGVTKERLKTMLLTVGFDNIVTVHALSDVSGRFLVSVRNMAVETLKFAIWVDFAYVPRQTDPFVSRFFWTVASLETFELTVHANGSSSTYEFHRTEPSYIL